MKKFFAGIFIGALITCGVFYFINKNKEDEQKENLAELLAFVKQGQATSLQLNEAINDSTAALVVQTLLTIILSANDEIYFYSGKDISQMEKTGLAYVNEILDAEKKRSGVKDLMIIIKPTPASTYKNSIYLLDAITKAGIQPGHYAEVDLSEKEKNYIQNYKKN